MSYICIVIINEETMKELIENAIQMINNHDWYWMMCDYGYSDNLKKAEDHRNQFARVLSSISDTHICTALRNLWIANYNLANAFVTERNGAIYKAEIETLSNQLNLETL